MKLLVKPEINYENESKVLVAQCEHLCFCIGLCLCDDKLSGFADDDTEDILF